MIDIKQEKRSKNFFQKMLILFFDAGIYIIDYTIL